MMSQSKHSTDGLDPIQAGQTHESITARSQAQHHQASSLKQTAAGQEGGAQRSQRRAAPSPLQASTTAASPVHSPNPSRTAATRLAADAKPRAPDVTQSPPSQPASPRTPKERLDDLLASERTFYRPEESPPSSTGLGIETKLADSEAAKKSSSTLSHSNRTQLSIDETRHTISRSVTDPIVSSKITESLPAIRAILPATSSAHREEMGRAQMRTSSIDSAISSLSTGQHSSKSSQDLQRSDAASPDITSLVSTAGSPEAVIQHLLKEKKTQTAQNEQLWRLVDKQRAMILGLNKDLERALRDKERYRKKLKDTLAEATSKPNRPNSTIQAKRASKSDTAKQVDTSAALESKSRQPVNVEAAPSPVEIVAVPDPLTPPAEHKRLEGGDDARHVTRGLESISLPASTSRPQNQRGQSDLSPDAVLPRKLTDNVTEVPHSTSAPPSRGLPTDPPVRVFGLNSTRAAPPPRLTVIQGSPTVSEGLKAFPSPPRKAPPAPLNLGKSINTSSHLHQTDPADESDSDYDDVLEVDEIPTVNDRGRRKTREDDDKQREAAAQKDAELRSLSKKTKSSKSRDNDAAVTHEAMPPPPRQAVGISPPAMQITSPGAVAGSLAGMLSLSETSSPGMDATKHSVLVQPPMSPGLPVSPRPLDRALAAPLPRNPRDGSSSNPASPPMSPRALTAFPAMPLSPRAPRQAIPLPPNTPLSMASPGLAKSGRPEFVMPASVMPTQHLEKPENGDSTKNEVTQDTQVQHIYQGFVTEEYPHLLLPPNALPSIEVHVASSRLKPSRASLMFPARLDEDPVFTLAVFSRSDRKELWRVEKDSASLAQLDAFLKQSAAFTATLPDKTLFNGHAPAKIDARRLALNQYLDMILETHMDLPSALELCRYLSTNTVEPDDTTSIDGQFTGSSSLRTESNGRSVKSGYLTKRGKNFGGWKARFFVLDGPIFKYYEAPGGAHLGTIRLQSAQIGKQAQHADYPADNEDDQDNQYRHAFLILEPKRKDTSSLVRHVLCAESDKERDDWVKSLMQWVNYSSEVDEAARAQKKTHDDGSATVQNSSKKRGPNKLGIDQLQGLSYESVSQGNLPHNVNRPSMSTGSPSPPVHGYDRDPLAQITKPISAPINATIIADSGAWGNKQGTLSPDDKIKQKKRSFFGFGSKPRASSETEQGSDSSSSLTQMSYEQHGPIRAVFGAPLAEAVRYNHPANIDVDLPAVVYRCIEYLEANNAASEEGIFRLSGSNVVIKSLRERFNVEGDVNLVTDNQYYDIHAVASLLKLYLRELPSTILTRELHLDFLAVTEIHDVNEKVNALNILVHKLPRSNLSLLRYLASFLINVINHSDVNKMTVRNVGIVFSPTLNIPAPVFALFLQQYEGIFEADALDEATSPVSVTVTAPTLTPDDIRSPRRQHFQELPTPSYTQQNFPRGLSQTNHAAFNTGFAPMQPTYGTIASTMGGPEYGSLAHTMAGPSYDNLNDTGPNAVGGGMPGKQYREQHQQQQSSATASTKAKRRESSMFSMGFPSKKASSGQLRDEAREF